MKKLIGVAACLAVGCAMAQPEKELPKEQWMIWYRNNELNIAFAVTGSTQEEAIKQMNTRMQDVETCKKAKNPSKCWEDRAKSQAHVLN